MNRFVWLVLLCALHTPLYAQSPQRIVSLLPSLTESVCALGECARLVGVDRYANHPASVQQLPKLGGGLDPNIEAIASLRPDLVLMATSSRGAERLRALNIQVMTLEPKNYADVKQTLLTLEQTLALPSGSAQRVWQDLQNAVDVTAKNLPAAAKTARVYFEVDPAPYAAGEASFIGETLARLGASNVVPANLGAFPKLNPEFVVKANPDVIMLSERSSQNLKQRPGWQHLRAVREQRICRFSAQEADVIVRPGPRMAEAARIMAQCLVDKTKGAGQ
jgi:iron complex transport system substrate-binding protein